jgi:aldose 1-epimerase
MAQRSEVSSVPSGAQYEIGHGSHKAVVTQVGATLREYTVDGIDVVDGFSLSEISPAGRGQVLAPWPNRLEDGQYVLDGRAGRAALDEPERANAIHGLVRWLPWEVTSRAQNVVMLRCTLYAQPGYPWQLEISVEYRLGREGLGVTASAVNVDGSRLPFGIGFHPYVTAGDRVDTASLRLPASRCLVTDDRGLPVTDKPVIGTDRDFLASRTIGETQLDTAFSALQRDPDGLARVEVELSDSRTVTVWMDECFPYIMAYTGDTLDPVWRRRRAIAIEPMTCPPNAFRSGTSLVHLDPGGTWTGRWGLSPH